MGCPLVSLEARFHFSFLFLLPLLGPVLFLFLNLFFFFRKDIIYGFDVYRHMGSFKLTKHFHLETHSALNPRSHGQIPAHSGRDWGLGGPWVRDSGFPSAIWVCVMKDDRKLLGTLRDHTQKCEEVQ